MANYKGIIEFIATGDQHHFNVENVENKSEAENKAIKDLSAELHTHEDNLEILVCVEVLTEKQVEEFENSIKLISELVKRDQFLFNGKTYVVQKKYRNDDSPLITECGQLFHNEDLPVKYLGKKTV